MTAGQWRAKVAANSATKQRRESLWQGDGYIIKEKADRNPIAFLAKFESKNRQICQVRLDKFTTNDAAVALLKKVAGYIISGAGTDPYVERDRLLAELPGAKPLNGAKKRRAARAKRRIATMTPCSRNRYDTGGEGRPLSRVTEPLSCFCVCSLWVLFDFCLCFCFY